MPDRNQTVTVIVFSSFWFHFRTFSVNSCARRLMRREAGWSWDSDAGGRSGAGSGAGARPSGRRTVSSGWRPGGVRRPRSTTSRWLSAMSWGLRRLKMTNHSRHPCNSRTAQLKNTQHRVIIIHRHRHFVHNGCLTFRTRRFLTLYRGLIIVARVRVIVTMRVWRRVRNAWIRKGYIWYKVSRSRSK